MPEDRAEQVTHLDQALWRKLADATTTEQFCRSWLALQSRMVGGVSAGVVALEQPKPFRSNEALAIRDPESHLELAVRGDGSGAKIEGLLRDATGERFRVTLAEKADWRGWRVAVPPRRWRRYV